VQFVELVLGVVRRTEHISKRRRRFGRATKEEPALEE
jgi:hypothetical protein